MSFKLYVVSLENELLRRTSIGKNLSAKELNFDFINGVDLREKNNIESFSLYNPSLAKKNSISRDLTRGEIGCALSHIKCYKQFIETEEDWALILEDDALVERVSFDLIGEITTSVEETDVETIILGYSKLSIQKEKRFYLMEPIKTKIRCRDHSLGLPWRNWTCGTVAYLINRKGALKLLNGYKENGICTVADDWLFFHEFFGLKIFHIRPLIVFEDYANLPSAIQDERALVSKKITPF